MRHSAFAIGVLLLLATTWFPVAHAAAGPKASSRIDFRTDDAQGQLIARKLLAKEIAEADEVSSGPSFLRTAWVHVSDSKPPVLFVMLGCSPTGNCDLYGYERARRGWRLVLNSDAQTCSVLSSSHGGRRDVSAYMHGSATDGTIKTYWWRRSRYVRVSERERVWQQP